MAFKIKDKTFAVLWSGGLDSTYLIQYLLDSGASKVSAYSIKIENNKEQAKAEEKSINKLKDIFREKYPLKFYYERILTMYSEIHGIIYLPQSPLFILAAHLIPNHDYTAIGYVMNDDAISFIPEIKRAYYGYKGLRDGTPKLVFPLVHYNKKVILERIDPLYLKHISYCEIPVLGKACQECPSCKRHSDALGIKIVSKVEEGVGRMVRPRK